MGTFIFMSVNWLLILAAFVAMYISTEDDASPGYRAVMRTGMGLCLLVVTVAVIGKMMA